MNTLEIVCNTLGWHGGTIHQCQNEFFKLPMSRKDKICNDLMPHISDKSFDTESALWFFRARIGQ